MKKYFLIITGFLSLNATGQKIDSELLDPKVTEVWEEVEKVIPALTPWGAPSDAIVLFDGNDFSEWEHQNGDQVKWSHDNGAMTIVPGTGNIRTKRTFGDIQLHIEWMAPTEVVGKGQDQGNSGIFLQERYEVQVLDSYTTETYANGQAGSVYKQHIPLVNANRPPLTWQSYDIVYKAPRFNDRGKVIVPARITAFLNGILIQNNVEIWGPTEYKGLPVYKFHEDASLMLQDHGNPVKFRNIWVRKL